MDLRLIYLAFFLFTFGANILAQRLYDNEYYCGNKPADVVFLLDSSNSIWGPFFQKQLQFVKDVISMFQIGENTTRVGVLTYSSNVNREFYLDKFHTKEDVLSAIGRISQMHGYATHTNKAIKFMREKMFSVNHGAREDVPQIGIVLTDGQSSNMLMTVWEASKAKRQKIYIFSIGIGSRINTRELRMMATRPASEYFFRVSDFNALQNIKNILAVRTCRVTPKPTTTTSTTTTTTTTTTPAPTTTSLLQVAQAVCKDGVSDVIFAFDSTTTISDADLDNQMSFAKEIVNTLNVQANGTRIGAILYSDQVVNALDLNDLYDRDDVIATLDKTKRTAGSNRLDLAFKHIRTKSFRRGLARRNSAQLAIVFTGSPSTYIKYTTTEAHKSIDSGISIIPIAVGNFDIEEIKSITGTSGQFYQVPSFRDLSTLIGEVALEACRVPKAETPIQDQACGSRQEADIMFVLDSVNAGRTNTKRALAFLKDLTKELAIDKDKIQVGLMSAECQQDSPGFALSSNKNGDEVKNALTKVKTVDFSALLKQMRHGAFSHRQGGRRHAKKVAVLVIDGSLEKPLRALTEAQRAKLHGVEVIVVQVGEEKPQEEVLMMCDSPSKETFFKVSDYKDLPAVKQKIWDSLCDEL
ncbi:collagen alpha-3(VI) chain-like isoform X2 [Saccostrea echinata]|uniref:collagen alpha-3(VI) chain-like isoform X2 n=1 Tax=Saccostrea echinata TaxID=191078 RepID=UPI002A810BEE|nr:collagen alpha-3(VI) chain-like isoform X2 [Saccostrea echinata]